jgi:YVTN family beta-propeller protein
MRGSAYHRKVRRSGGGGLRRLLLGLVVPLLAVLTIGWIGATTWYPNHLMRATGRSDTGPIFCLHCHASFSEASSIPLPDVGNYASPTGLAVAPDGARLYVVASGTGQLLEIDTASGATLRRVDVGARPHGVAISPDGRRLAVSRRDADEVLFLDVASLEITATHPTGAEPIGLVFSPDGRRLWVANGTSDDVTLIDVGGVKTDAQASDRIVAGNEPYAVARSANGSVVAVANRLARVTAPGEIPVSEITVIDGAGTRVLARAELLSAHLSEGVALAAEGHFALATAVRIRNLLPLTQVSRGGVMNSTVVFLDARAGGRIVQLPLDDLNTYYADPAGIVMTPDDTVAFVAHAGARTITAIDVQALRAVVDRTETLSLDALADRLDLADEYVLARIPTRYNPQTLALSPDGSRLYITERLSDSIAVVDVARLEVVERFELGDSPEPSARRRGEIVFTDASGTFQGQFSCRSCHPDGHTDSLIWDFVIDGVGSNLLETRSLRGVRQTAPFKWSGKNPDLATQCGPRFAMVLTRSDPFDPEQLSDLVTFIESIPTAPHRSLGEDLDEALERGRALFFRDATNSGEVIPVAQRCSTCHRPPLYTDRLMTDVGTGGKFDTPHLFDVGASAPYLHDGRSATLEEIWTVHSLQDEHGVTGDLSKVQLNDLMVFLRSL